MQEKIDVFNKSGKKIGEVICDRVFTENESYLRYYCQKCKRWFKVTGIRMKGKIPKQCLLCHDKNYWKPRYFFEV